MSQRHICQYISISMCAFVPSRNIFVIAFFKEGAFRAERESSYNESSITKSFGGNWTNGLVQGGFDVVTLLCGATVQNSHFFL